MQISSKIKRQIFSLNFSTLMNRNLNNLIRIISLHHIPAFIPPERSTRHEINLLNSLANFTLLTVKEAQERGCILRAFLMLIDVRFPRNPHHGFGACEQNH